MEQDINQETIREWLTAQMAELLELSPEEVDPDKPLEELNAISLDVVHVVAAAMKHFAIKVPRAEFAGQDTINKLAVLIESHKG